MHFYYLFSILFFEDSNFKYVFTLFFIFFFIFFCLETFILFYVPTISLSTSISLPFNTISFSMDTIFSFWLDSICNQEKYKKLTKMEEKLKKQVFFLLNKCVQVLVLSTMLWNFLNEIRAFTNIYNCEKLTHFSPLSL